MPKGLEAGVDCNVTKQRARDCVVEEKKTKQSLLVGKKLAL